MPKTIGVSGLKPARGAVHKVRTPRDSNFEFRVIDDLFSRDCPGLWYDYKRYYTITG